jgi:hypothetical protein
MVPHAAAGHHAFLVSDGTAAEARAMALPVGIPRQRRRIVMLSSFDCALD